MTTNNLTNAVRNTISTLALTVAASMLLIAHAQAGPLVHYKLDDGAGTNAIDTVGTQNGTLENMEPGDWISGTIGTGALDFSGTDERVSSNPAPSSLPVALRGVGAGDFMISAWLKTSAFGTVTAIGGDFGSGSAANHGLALRTDGLSVRDGGSGITSTTVNVPFGTSVTTGSWVHVVGVRDAGNDEIRVYRNGLLDGTASYDGTIDVSGNNLGVSGRQLTLGITLKPAGNNTIAALTGTLDDVGVYQEMRTAGEIRALYTLGLSAGQDGSLFDYNYDLSQAQQLFDLHEAGSGTTTLGDTTWVFTNNIDATGKLDGDLFTMDEDTFLVLSGGGSTGASGLIVLVVPEPSSVLLLGLGILGLVRHSRRRRQTA